MRRLPAPVPRQPGQNLNSSDIPPDPYRSIDSYNRSSEALCFSRSPESAEPAPEE